MQNQHLGYTGVAVNFVPRLAISTGEQREGLPVVRIRLNDRYQLTKCENGVAGLKRSFTGELYQEWFSRLLF
jgi:hypothetical protein